MNPEKISKFIYELRTEKKLSQYQLADMIPISRQAVSKWERGQTIPDSSTLVRLSDIFEVSINELLKGERSVNNSIEELETTTLSIVDDSNRKTRKIRKIIVIFNITTILLLLGFLSYYFITSYNTIKVYTISGRSKHFDVHEGLFITTKQKNYMKIGELVPTANIIINNVRLYYKKGAEEKIIFEDEDYTNTIMDLHGYQEHFPEEDISFIMKSSYLEITYNNTEKETITLSFIRDFVNDFQLLIKNENGKETNIKNSSKTLIEQDIIDFIKRNGALENNTYVLDIFDDENNIRFSYYEEMNQVIMEKNREIVWIVFTNLQSHSCPKMQELKEKEVSDDECVDLIKKSIKKYLYENG